MKSATPSQANPVKGIVYALIGYTAWVLADALTKSATEASLPPFEIIMLTCPVIVIIMFLKTRRLHATLNTTLHTLWPNDWRAQWILSIFGFGANFFCVVALRHLPLSIFYVAVFTAPMMIGILAAVFLKEHLGLLKGLAIVAGFAGVVIAIDPSPKVLEADWIGYGAAFLSSLCYAISVTLSRFLTRSEAVESITFFNALNQTALSAIILLIMGNAQSISGTLFIILMLAGFFNTGGNFCAYASVKYAPAATVAPYHYTQIISGAFIAVFVWHETLSWPFFLGTIIIIASGLYIAREAHLSMIETK